MDIDHIENEISEANADELAAVMVAAIERLGELGRTGAEAIHAKIGEALKTRHETALLEEGVGQMEIALGLEQE